MKVIYGIIGFPVKHSLSPAMHNAAFRELGIEAEYQMFEVETIHPPSSRVTGLRRTGESSLRSFIKKIRRENIQGLSVTIPHKVAVMKYLDKVEEKAKAIGAVNTIINKNGYLIGTNTDCDGAMQALKEVTEIRNKKVVVIGAGGAARAIIYGLKENSADIVILNKDRKEAAILAEKFSVKEDDLTNLTNYEPDILIHATPVGMEPNTNESLVPVSFLKKSMVVFDVVYKPLMTKLLTDAKKAGCKIITGEKMLLYQGVRQFELWTGEKAPVEVMKKAIEEGSRKR